MNKTPRLLALVMLSVVQVTCNSLSPTPTPPPGWSDDVRDLFVDASAFPAGWAADLRLETGDYLHANHVHREFFGNLPVSGLVSQDIWRAYTIVDAEEKYAELRRSQFQPRLSPEEMVSPWLPPEEIDFQSHIANESYLACGWEEWASCQYIARYQNYVTYLRLDREAHMGKLDSRGLTYAEIEAVLKAADVQFADALDRFSGQQ